MSGSFMSVGFFFVCVDKTLSEMEVKVARCRRNKREDQIKPGLHTERETSSCTIFCVIMNRFCAFKEPLLRLLNDFSSWFPYEIRPPVFLRKLTVSPVFAVRPARRLSLAGFPSLNVFLL